MITSSDYAPDNLQRFLSLSYMLINEEIKSEHLLTLFGRIRNRNKWDMFYYLLVWGLITVEYYA